MLLGFSGRCAALVWRTARGTLQRHRSKSIAEHEFSRISATPRAAKIRRNDERFPAQRHDEVAAYEHTPNVHVVHGPWQSLFPVHVEPQFVVVHRLSRQYWQVPVQSALPVHVAPQFVTAHTASTQYEHIPPVQSPSPLHEVPHDADLILPDSAAYATDSRTAKTARNARNAFMVMVLVKCLVRELDLHGCGGWGQPKGGFFLGGRK